MDIILLPQNNSATNFVRKFTDNPPPYKNLKEIRKFKGNKNK